MVRREAAHGSHFGAVSVDMDVEARGSEEVTRCNNRVGVFPACCILLVGLVI